MRARNAIRTTEPTRYEVVLRHPGGEERLGFTARTGGRGLWTYVAENVGRLIALAGEGAPITRTGGGTRARIAFGPDVTMTFSGRTERECASEAEQASA